MWPGMPVVPCMSAGATDGAFLTPAGIPTYGVSGMFGDPDGNGAHGLNERMRVKSVYDGRDFLYRGGQDLRQREISAARRLRQPGSQWSFSLGRMIWLTWPTRISARPLSQP